MTDLKRRQILTIAIVVFTVAVLIPKTRAYGMGVSEIGPVYEKRNLVRGNTYRCEFTIGYEFAQDAQISWWFSPFPDPLVVVWDQPPPINVLGGGGNKQFQVWFNLVVPIDAPIKSYYFDVVAHGEPIGGGVGFTVSVHDEFRVVSSTSVPEFPIGLTLEILFIPVIIYILLRNKQRSINQTKLRRCKYQAR